MFQLYPLESRKQKPQNHLNHIKITKIDTQGGPETDTRTMILNLGLEILYAIIILTFTSKCHCQKFVSLLPALYSGVRTDSTLLRLVYTLVQKLHVTIKEWQFYNFGELACISDCCDTYKVVWVRVEGTYVGRIS